MYKESAFIRDLFTRFVKRAYQEQHYERSSFDPISQSLISKIMEISLKKGKCDLSAVWLSRLIQATRRQVRSRLLHLARYGIIRVEGRIRSDGTGLNDSNIIEVNPVLFGIYKTNSGAKASDQFVSHYFMIGFSRLDDDVNELQGFWIDCKYGEKEPEEGSPSSWQSRLIGIMNYREDVKAAKVSDNFKWSQLRDDFAAGCGKIWTECQGRSGLGYNKAVWDAETGTLGPIPRREKSELGKLFQSYGGRKAAIAWYVFCGGVESIDENGKRIYDPKSPHRQFVTIDKKPSQFAKHFNAILSDPIFIDLYENQKENVENHIAPNFGPVFYTKARLDIEKENI